jgi:hypothetical protein
MSNQPKLKTRILKEVDKKRDEMTEFLRKLIRIPSVVGREGEAQKFMEKTFRDLGLEVDVWEPDVAELQKHPAFFKTISYTKFGYNGRPNVIGKLSGTGQGRSLILDKQCLRRGTGGFLLNCILCIKGRDNSFDESFSTRIGFRQYSSELYLSRSDRNPNATKGFQETRRPKTNTQRKD